jgi:predicted RNA-binding protein with EMAP domain
MLNSEFVDQFLPPECAKDRELEVVRKLFENYDYEKDELDSWDTCKFFTRLLIKIEKMENRIQELEEQLESTSYNLGELEDRVDKKGVYMEDW